MTDPPAAVATPRWRVHVILAGLGLAAALLLREPAIAVLVAPSALLVAAALTWRAPAPAISVAATDDRLVAGDDTTVRVTVHSGTTVAVRLPLQGPLRGRVGGTTDTRSATALCAPVGGRVELDVHVTATRWGAATVGPVEVGAWSPGGLLHTTTRGGSTVIRILPHTPPAEALVRPTATHVAHGTQRSRAVAEGTEFADLRPFLPGDRARDVSPVISARRGQPWVVRRHPDRRTDIVLLLDAHDPTESDDVLTAARSIARGHLHHRDRVGVTAMAGQLRWLPPGDGARHEHRIATALVDARVAHSWVRPAVEELPRRVLPPGALVLGITPGTDPRLADTAVVLHRRGWDVAVLVLSPDPTPRPEDDATDRAARRLLALQRRAVRDRLLHRSVATVAWDPSTPVDTALAQLRGWRRRQPGARR